MKVFLEQNTVIDVDEKNKIEERLSMFEDLWDGSPTVQKMRAQYYEKGEKAGIEKGIEK